MANEETKVDVLEEADVETPEGDLTDDTDWKAEAIKSRRMASRLRSQLTKATEKKIDPPPAATETKKGFDYAEKAFLTSKGIQADEYTLVHEVMQATGKSLDDVLDAKYFQSDLKERRDAKASKEAIPSGSKRSSTSARDGVDYWIAKGELPPWSERELRYKVNAEMTKRARNKTQFTDNAVA